MNLFPNYASAEQLGSTTYREHLERFVETCHPTVLSYDHYALMDDGSLRNGYWQNLEQMRGAGLKHGLTTLGSSQSAPAKRRPAGPSID